MPSSAAYLSTHRRIVRNRVSRPEWEQIAEFPTGLELDVINHWVQVGVLGTDGSNNNTVHQAGPNSVQLTLLSQARFASWLCILRPLFRFVWSCSVSPYRPDALPCLVQIEIEHLNRMTVFTCFIEGGGHNDVIVDNEMVKIYCLNAALNSRILEIFDEMGLKNCFALTLDGVVGVANFALHHRLYLNYRQMRWPLRPVVSAWSKKSSDIHLWLKSCAVKIKSTGDVKCIQFRKEIFHILCMWTVYSIVFCPMLEENSSRNFVVTSRLHKNQAKYFNEQSSNFIGLLSRCTV